MPGFYYGKCLGKKIGGELGGKMGESSDLNVNLTLSEEERERNRGPQWALRLRSNQPLRETRPTAERESGGKA